MYKPRPAAPSRPNINHFIDSDGSTDHEAFDMAIETYIDAYTAWDNEHGEVFWQIEHCWDRREFELSIGCR